MTESLAVLYHHTAGHWLRSRLRSLEAEAALTVTIVPPDHPAGLADVLAGVLADAEVVWHVLEPFTAVHIAAAPRLRLIQKVGVGVNTIDIEAANERGIAVCNMPGTNSQAVAEMTLALILSCLRQLPYLHARTAAGEGWKARPDLYQGVREVGGLTIGLVGYGSIPRRLAPILGAMGARVIYTAREPKADADVEWTTLPQLLASSDVVSLHLPLTEETALLIGRDEIKLMKPGSILVNTSRGGVVDQVALVEALRSGRLAAAGLDVFAVEPLPADDPITELPNVVLSPHVSWQTRDTLERSLIVAVENCRRLRNGEPLLHRVNPQTPR